MLGFPLQPECDRHAWQILKRRTAAGQASSFWQLRESKQGELQRLQSENQGTGIPPCELNLKTHA